MDLDAALAAGYEPRAVKSGARGLVVSVPGGTFRRLIDVQGRLTPAGEYFYAQRGQRAPDQGFDYAQKPTRRGRRELIQLVDGSAATTRTWDALRRQWRFTKTGRLFYAESRDNYTITFPVTTVFIHSNGTVYERPGDWLASTSDKVGLGEIALPTLMPEAEQLAEVRRRAEEYVAQQPVIDGERVLHRNHYEIYQLDPEREITFNRESVRILPDGTADVDATLHRPLRFGRPWNFGFNGVCPEAYDDTDDACVPHQLRALLARRGLTEGSIEEHLDTSYRQLYKPHDPENPYAQECEDGTVEMRNWREAGVTCAMLLALGRRLDIAVHVVWQRAKVSSFVPETAKSSLALYVHGCHAFFVGDPKTKEVIAKMKTTRPHVRPDVVTRVVPKEKTLVPPAVEWQSYTPGAPAGYYRADDLQALRLQLHGQGIVPLVQLSGMGVMKALRIKAEPQAGANADEALEHAVVQRAMREDIVCDLFAQFLKRDTGRRLVYRGESLATFADMAFRELCKPPHRRQLTNVQADLVWERQGRACNMCGARTIKPNVDHMIPLCEGGGNGPENAQILCLDCHSVKTTLEQLSFVEDGTPLMSRFNRETYAAFVEARKPPQVVADLHVRNGPASSVDIKRCRFNGFVQNSYDLPVYAPTDEVRPCTPGQLGDYHWLDLGALGPRRSARSVFPYWGPGWYFKGTVAFLLDAGIATWQDVKLTFSAAAHRPASYLTDRLRLLERLWLEVGESNMGQIFLREGKTPTDDPAALAKMASVALAGLWGRRDQWQYRLVTSSCEDDVLFSGHRSVSPTPGSPEQHGVVIFKDFVTRQKVLTLSSMRPVHSICLEAERVNVARAMLLAERFCQPSRLLCLRVDELIVDIPRRDREKFEACVRAATYADAHTVLPRGRVARYQQPGATSEPVFKPVQALKEVPWTGAELKDPEAFREEAPALQAAQALEWRTIREPEEGPDGFVQREIVPHVVRGGSCCVLGKAGCGKTEALKAVEAALKGAGLTCAKICLTHVGTRNLGEGGETAHHFAMHRIMRGTFSGHVVLVDEISFVSLDLIAALEVLRLKGVRILCFGDFAQLPPISNRWRGCAAAPDVFEHSRLFRQWSDCTRFVLTRCRRSDVPHFAFYCGVKDRPFDEVLAEALERYPERREDATWNITISHWRRKRLNESLQRKAAAAFEGPKVLVEGELEYTCFAGTRLVGCNSKHPQIVNGAFLLVLAVSAEGAVLRDEDTGKEFQVTRDALAKHTRLRWALTLCSVQGRSLAGTIAIHDVQSRHFGPTHLYVALSRARDGGGVWLVRPQGHKRPADGSE